MQGIYNYEPETNIFLGYILLRYSVVTVSGTRNVISYVEHSVVLH
jgi:hypothetical protein